MRAAIAALALASGLATSAGAASFDPASSYSGRLLMEDGTDAGIHIGKMSAQAVDPSDLSLGWQVVFTSYLEHLDDLIVVTLGGTATDLLASNDSIQVAAQLSGAVDNFYSLFDGGPSTTFGGTIDVALDGTWSCSGDCRVPVYDYAESSWLLSENTLTRGTYS